MCWSLIMSVIACMYTSHSAHNSALNGELESNNRTASFGESVQFGDIEYMSTAGMFWLSVVWTPSDLSANFIPIVCVRWLLS